MRARLRRADVLVRVMPLEGAYMQPGPAPGRLVRVMPPPPRPRHRPGRPTAHHHGHGYGTGTGSGSLSGKTRIAPSPEL